MARVRLREGVPAALLALAMATSCGGRPPCGACPEATVCDLDGTCRELAPRPGLRFARALRLRPRDWGGARRDHRRERGHPLDELLLGGDADGRLYLAFDVPEGEVVAAVLRLAPAARAPNAGAMIVRAFRTRPFEGSRVSGRRHPRRVGRSGPARRLDGGEGRPVYLDVTELLRGHEGSRVFLGVAADGGSAPWRVASPVAVDVGLHPHLDLRLR